MYRESHSYVSSKSGVTTLLQLSEKVTVTMFSEIVLTPGLSYERLRDILLGDGNGRATVDSLLMGLRGGLAIQIPLSDYLENKLIAGGTLSRTGQTTCLALTFR